MGKRAAVSIHYQSHFQAFQNHVILSIQQYFSIDFYNQEKLTQ
jgi:hypothetical protein